LGWGNTFLPLTSSFPSLESALFDIYELGSSFVVSLWNMMKAARVDGANTLRIWVGNSITKFYFL
jgi:hypothetical protein